MKNNIHTCECEKAKCLESSSNIVNTMRIMENKEPHFNSVVFECIDDCRRKMAKNGIISRNLHNTYETL